MRLGKVRFCVEYVVDLDDEAMVDHAEDCICEDIRDLVKFDNIYELIKTKEDSSLNLNDIPEFLYEDKEQNNE